MAAIWLTTVILLTRVIWVWKAGDSSNLAYGAAVVLPQAVNLVRARSA